MLTQFSERPPDLYRKNELIQLSEAGYPDGRVCRGNVALFCNPAYVDAGGVADTCTTESVTSRHMSQNETKITNIRIRHNMTLIANHDFDSKVSRGHPGACSGLLNAQP
jgi:hypothetical protein